MKNKITRIIVSLLLVLSIINSVLLGTLVSTFYSTVKYIEEYDIPNRLAKIESKLNDNEEMLGLTQEMLDDWNAMHDENLTMDDVADAQPEETPQEKPVVLELISDITDVRRISNATAEEINRTIQATCPWMYNYNPNLGELYVALEKEYNVNAYFALAVSYSEVGTQQMSKLAKNHNNIYGLMNKSFDNIEDCIRYFFNLINKYYVGEGRYSVEDISDKYCLGNPTWIKNVTAFMKKLPQSSR